MLVKMFIAKKTRTPIVVEKNANGSYAAYEANKRCDGGNKYILQNVWCIRWLIETLHNMYDEGLIQEV